MTDRLEELESIRATYAADVEHAESDYSAAWADVNAERQAFADLQGAIRDLEAWDNSPEGLELAQLKGMQS